MGLAMNHLKGFRRERRRHLPVPDVEPATLPEHPLEAEESRLRVRLALTALPPESQRLLEAAARLSALQSREEALALQGKALTDREAALACLLAWDLRPMRQA